MELIVIEFYAVAMPGDNVWIMLNNECVELPVAEIRCVKDKNMERVQYVIINPESYLVNDNGIIIKEKVFKTKQSLLESL